MWQCLSNISQCLYTAENIIFSCQGTADVFKRVMISNRAFKLKLSPWSTPHLQLLWPHPSQFLWQCPRQPWPGRVSRWHRHPPWRPSFLPAAAAPLWLPCGRAAPPQTPSWYPPGSDTQKTQFTKIKHPLQYGYKYVQMFFIHISAIIKWLVFKSKWASGICVFLCFKYNIVVLYQHL